MDIVQKGYQITAAFKYIQKVFNECQRLIFKIDNQMAPEWSTIYGNRITKDVTSSLQDADRWIVEAIFRVYGTNNDQTINKAITISFWGGNIDQPVITAGKITYSDPSKRDHWDLWNIWFNWEENENRELDGKIKVLMPDGCKYVKEALIFSLPLISITDDETLIEKIIKPLKAL
ncbi:hypothetical protein KL86SPO_31179 [uncultured Sporomusa sp.]|uniref:Uncharacterized protein n=1 Tax=uncultured Sporomusa sp. TaxID=307249 RepID=A0A212LU62_9FIRM|nr:hypothetical protein [uncultured Sporomusa sp.]SCM81000.1 hypothetical protein KL86SPO_31179 [uncultured Sporomusa sp.]